MIEAAAPMQDPASSTARPAEPAAITVEGPAEMATIEQTVSENSQAGAERAQAMFGDMNARAKSAMEKSGKVIEEMTDFSKGNVEALVASGRAATKGAEALFQNAAEYSRRNYEKATSIFQSFAGVKSPTELMQLQSELAKSSFDTAIADVSKASESYVKYVSDVMEPIQNRFAVAVDKMKAPIA
jgi:phasin family protein